MGYFALKVKGNLFVRALGFEPRTFRVSGVRSIFKERLATMKMEVPFRGLYQP